MSLPKKPSLLRMYMNGNIVLQIVVGIVLGAVLAFIFPELASKASVLGTLFVKALKSIAPLLVFVLVGLVNDSLRAGLSLGAFEVVLWSL